MISAVLIQKNDADSLPAFFSLMEPVAGMAFTTEPDRALAFAREADARAFAAKYLPALMPTLTFPRKELS